MAILYLLGIRIFHFLVIIASLFNTKAKHWLKGRKNIFNNLKASIQSEDKIAWFHCASLGEFEQGRPVIEGFRKEHPSFKILLTFYSPSGYEIRKNYEYADFIFYLPLDTPRNAKRFLNITHPEIVFFIKYEFWYFFLKRIGEKRIPLYMVSGIFRKNQRFFKKFGTQSRKMLRWFTHFFVQNEESKRLLQSINLKNVSITGDTRFDRVYEITQNSKDLPIIEKFVDTNPALVAGSTWKPDEDIIIKYFNETHFKFKLIIAPHEIHKENINRIIKSFSGDKVVIKYSEADEQNVKDADVLIIDCIGLLSSVYKYGNIAYIGGGFGKGIHNILEAATFGLPVFFGPNHQKFQEAVDLINMAGAISISSFNEFKSNYDNLISDPQKVSLKGNVSKSYIEQKRGATDKILSFVNL